MPRLTHRFGLSRYNADEHYKRALEFYDKRDINEAILAMGLAIELLPTNSEYYAARGFYYLEDGVKKKAAADFKKALELYPFEMLAHYGRGVIGYQDKNWQDAVAHFTDAYRADPERPETLYYLALSHHHNGENRQALPFMRQAYARLEALDDKRKGDAQRWVRQLERLVEQIPPSPAISPPESSPPSSLPPSSAPPSLPPGW